MLDKLAEAFSAPEILLRLIPTIDSIEDQDSYPDAVHSLITLTVKIVDIDIKGFPGLMESVISRLEKLQNHAERELEAGKKAEIKELTAQLIEILSNKRSFAEVSSKHRGITEAATTSQNFTKNNNNSPVLAPKEEAPSTSPSIIDTDMGNLAVAFGKLSLEDSAKEPQGTHH